MKKSLKKITATFMSFLFLFTLILVDGKLAYASTKPATPILQHNNWSGETDYEITMNIWWGENGNKWRLYENNKLIHEEELVNQSPQAQSASFKVTGKAKGTYSYKCELINEAGVSESSVINVTVTKEVDNNKPAVPSNLKAIAKDENSITVTWDKVAGINSYDLEVDGVIKSINEEKYTHDGLKAGSVHNYRVRSKNTNNVSEWSNLVTGKTLEKPEVVEKPEVPQNLIAKAKDSKTIELSWTSSNNVDYYELSLDGEIVKVNDNKYTHSGLVAESKHEYKVRAVNKVGASEFSNLVSATTLKEDSNVPEPGSDGLPERVIVGYWHNFDNGSTKTSLKDTSLDFDLIDVAFAESLSDQATMIFEPYNNTKEGFKEEIKYLQSKGKKVIISIGGQNGRLHLDTKEKEDAFVNSMVDIIKTYGFDGMDLDLEGGAVSLDAGDTDLNNPTTPKVVHLINGTKRIREEVGGNFILTMAPEITYVQGGLTAYAGPWGAYLPVINGLRDELTLLHVQHYNHGSQEALDGNTYMQGTADFEVAMAEMMITGFYVGRGTTNYFKGLPAEKIAIGLPSSPKAAGGGYISEEEGIKALNYLINGQEFGGKYKLQNKEGYKKFRGVMTWSTNWDETTGFKFSKAYRAFFDSIK